MGEPTIYRTPRQIIPPKTPDARTKEKWEKHRKKNGQSPALPKLKK